MAETANNGSAFYFCIRELLDRGEKRLHQIFLDRWSIYCRFNDTIKKWKNNSNSGSEIAPLCISATKTQKQLLQDGKIELWDISLTYLAIQAVSNEIQKSGIKLDATEDKCIRELKEERNKNAHGKYELSEDEFQHSWNNLSEILIKLGDDPVVVEGVKEKHFPQVKEDNTKKEYDLLTKRAIKLFKTKKYHRAIDMYDKILQLSGLTAENKAEIYCKRSGTCLMFETEDSYKLAKNDAEKAIQFKPCWEGYFCMANAQIKLMEWHDAKKSLKKALVLNPESSEIKNELDNVRKELEIIAAAASQKPSKQPEKPKEEEKEKEKLTPFFEQHENVGMTFPGYDDIQKGNQYRDGNGVKKDHKQAFDYYKKAADLGLTEGMYNLAMLLEDSNHFVSNPETSLYYLLKAATGEALVMHGSFIPEAQHALGMKYMFGEGVAKNFKLAIAWFKRAFENGFAASANYLGALHLNDNKGVEKSEEEAVKYFKYAAQNGNIFGMQNLAHFYFKSMFFEEKEGMKWLQLAAAKGNLAAGRELEKRQHEEKLVIKDIEFIEGSETRFTIVPSQHEKDIWEAAMNGSITAQRIACTWKYMDDALMAYGMNNIEALKRNLSKALGLDGRKLEIQGVTKDPILLNKRVQSFTCTINSISYKYTRQKPYDEKLWTILNCSFQKNDQNKYGLSNAEMAVDIDLCSLRLLYLQCEVLSEQMSPQCIETINNFIALAPEDHEKIPACHYLKAMYYMHMQDSKKLNESYEKGLAAEKLQLPCFLPYYYPYKFMLEMHYSIDELESENEMDDAQNSMNFSINENYKIAILKHRKDFVNSLNVDSTTNSAPITGRRSKKYSKSPTIISFDDIMNLLQIRNTYPSTLNTLKEITSNEMISDKIYEGYVLKAHIIDWPYFSRKVINTLVQDRNNTILKVKIEDSQKQPSKERVKEMIKTFRPNSLISIINPYIKEINNEKIVFVKYSNHVKIDDSGANKKCDFCREKKKTEKCNGCHLSQYCSKNCQKLDLIHLNHASVCDYLKTYADEMK